MSVSRDCASAVVLPYFLFSLDVKKTLLHSPFLFSKMGGTKEELKCLPAVVSVVPPASWANNNAEEMGRKVEVKGAACE